MIFLWYNISLQQDLYTYYAWVYSFTSAKLFHCINVPVSGVL